jgi:hypothetical protein
LDAIKDVVLKGTMPTRFYSLMHPTSKLSQDEKEIILKWVNESKSKLTALGTTE